ncbi:MAG: glycine zipper family protein [Methylococcaceae bacterium]|jgi:phage tail tape-measure protein
MNKLTTAVIFSATLAGCASQTGWTPTVDAYNDRHADHINQDTAQCQQLAEHASGGTVKETAKGAGVGALAGAAGGAVLGAIAGNAGTGAALGAAVGGIGGAAHQGTQSDAQYKRAFINCMRGRGHQVVN